MGRPKAIDIDAARRRLESEREALLRASTEGAADRAPVVLDQQSVGRLSRMDALQLQAMAQALDDRRLARVRRLDAALRRLDEGDYGFCLSCGEEIPIQRLEIDPATPLCVSCAE